MAENNYNQFKHCFCFNYGSLLFQVGVGILIGSLLQGTNGLDCYTCKHSSFPVPPGLPDNPACFTPTTATSSDVTKVTCTDPDIACMKGYGEGNYMGVDVKIMIRKCFILESLQREPDGCKDFVGEVYDNGDIINDKIRHIMTRGVLESLANIANLSTTTSGPNITEKMEGKIAIPDHLHMKGKYCWCDGKDLCNDAEGFKVLDPNETTTVSSNGHAHVQNAIPQLVLLFWIITTTTTATMRTIHVLSISLF